MARRQSTAITVPAVSQYVSVDFDVCFDTEDDPVLRTLGYDGVFLRLADLTAGTFDVAWDGLTDTGATVQSGRYVVEVTATNKIGSVALDATFAVRRVPPPPPPKPKPKRDAQRKK